jgi:Tfp pilus assembly protein PilO
MALASSIRNRFTNGRTRESKHRGRMRLAIIALVVIDCVLLALVIHPPIRSLTQRETDLSRRLAEYDTTLARVRQMRELRTKLQAAIHQDELFADAHFLQRQKAFSAIVSDLEKLASQNHVKSASIAYQVKEDPKQPAFTDLAVNMNVEGAYPDLVRFINKIEQSDLFWIIGDISVSNAQGRGGLRLNIQMDTYVVRPQGQQNG